MLAPSAGTLPPGHFLLEPYLFDVGVHGRFDRVGVRQRATPSRTSLTYALYGLANKVMIGALPIAGYTAASDGPNSSSVKLGDLTVLGQYRLAQFRPCHWWPTTSINVQQTFPTAKYDRLGERPNDGFGGGTYTTMVSIYTQTYFWLANGRILRMRVNVSQALSSAATVEDISVYGTASGFRGRAEPGSSSIVDASWEYSATRRWVLAFETVYRRDGQTRVSGRDTTDPASPPFELNGVARHTLAFAPAIEFSWKGNIGVLVGVRLIAAGRNTAFSDLSQ